MSLPRLYNTLTRQLEPLEPRTPGKVGIYCCGPTVYDVPHAGHARPAVAFDVLVRHLRMKGLEVEYVRNITDVDDKILQRAKETGVSPTALSSQMAQIYEETYRAIGCLDPSHQPKVSDHIPDVVALIERLVERKAAYVVERGDGRTDVYFSVRSFEGYGKLSRRRIDELIAGARVDPGDVKRDPLDFALWKGEPPDAWGWDSPWGHGRPGWHIECSAMCTRYLGHGFDVHGGGMDLIFPHHENEIAQSEAAEPDAGPFARIWMHNGFINVDKEKMSKSLGNFVTIRDVLERNDAEAFRWFLLTVHYRGPIQFETEKLPDGRVVFPGVDEAERRVDYVYTAARRLRELTDTGVTVSGRIPPEIAAFRDAAERAGREAEAALDDDLNTPVALAALGEIARHANELCDLAQKRRKDASVLGAAAIVSHAIGSELGRVAERLGLLIASPEAYAARTRALRLRLRGLSPDDIDRKVAERAEARQNKDFARSDAIRAELDALGVSLRDAPGGSEWTIGV